MADQIFVEDSNNPIVSEVLGVLDTAVLPCNVDTIQDLVDEELNEVRTTEERVPPVDQGQFDQAIEWLVDKRIITVDEDRVVRMTEEAPDVLTNVHWA